MTRTILSLVPASQVPRITRVVTRIIPLDHLLGGGMPRHRITTIWGEEGTGKTTVALHAAAAALRASPDSVAVYVDAESKFNSDWARSIIGEEMMDRLLVVSTAEASVMDEVIRALQEGIDDCPVSSVVFDSITSLLPPAALQAEVGDALIGAQARAFSQAFPRLARALFQSSAMAILVAQSRANIGGYGPSTRMAGGFWLKHYSAAVLSFHTGAQDKDHQELKRILVKLEKNQVGGLPEGSSVPLVIRKAPPYGVDAALAAVLYGVQAGVIGQKGAWFHLDGENLGQGVYNAAAALASNPDALQRLAERLLGAEYAATIRQHYQEVNNADN